MAALFTTEDLKKFGYEEVYIDMTKSYREEGIAPHSYCLHLGGG